VVTGVDPARDSPGLTVIDLGENNLA
jgi:hypothetical protein